METRHPLNRRLTVQSQLRRAKILTIIIIEIKFLKTRKKSKCTEMLKKSWETRPLPGSVTGLRIRTLQMPRP